MRVLRSTVLLAALGVAACSPTLDWREVRPEGGGLTLLMPCRPRPQVRQVELAGKPATLTLYACSAGDRTWGLAFADIGDPQRVGPALQALEHAARANIGATEVRPLALAVPGTTPNASSRRAAFVGHRPDGSEIREELAVFARGTIVFQATAVGSRLPADGVETFFGSLRAVP